MKKIISLATILFIILAGYQNGNASPVKATIQNKVVKASHFNTVDPNCSRQFAIPIQKFQSSIGAWGSIRNNQGMEWKGWALFDTGADTTRLRHPTMKTGKDTSVTMNSILSFGDLRAAESSVNLSPKLWDYLAPQNESDTSGSSGFQIGTIGTAIMKDFAFRVDDDKMYFSFFSQACTENQLKSQGYIRMDTSGFYQLEGRFVTVYGNYASSNIPTIWIDILGIKVPAQIDTGYQVASGRNYIQVNKPLMDKLKKQLPAPVSLSDAKIAYHIKNKGFTYLTSENNSTEVKSVSDIYIIPKPSDGGGIAKWDDPAAMISAPAFLNMFRSSEFRADKKSVWVKIR